MKKYAIVLNGDVSAPHLRIYSSFLDNKCIPYDVISWDRNNAYPKNDYTYKGSLSDFQSALSRLWAHIKYSFFVKRLIKTNQYEKLIVISPQVALFMPFFLEKKYKRKYIFDYRDLSLEQKAPFKPLMKLVLKNSYANVISSPGFKDYLPKGFEYILSHNFDIKTVESALKEKACPLPGGELKLLTIGAIRIDANYEVIDALGNANDVKLNFVGKGGATPILEKYSKEKCFSNIEFKGKYKKEEEGSIISQNTMINIFYPNWPSHIAALSNRFYNSLVYKRPMLVTKGGTQSYYVEKYGVGLSVENCEGLAERIKEYEASLDFNCYEKQCNELLRKFIKDYEYFASVVDQFIRS